jgi:putative CocE/NonD family hydrolase
MPDEVVSDEVVVERNVMVAMRDGIRLACDVYRPARNGQAIAGAFPVILERTPYDKSAVSRSEISLRALRMPRRREEVAAFFAQHGYVVIYQDCRGRYASEGVFRKYLDEAADGYDTCAWIVQQPWCNGRIGTMGLSYAAHTQAALASLNPPGLAAMFIDSGGFSNAFQSGIRQGGAFELKQATWAYNQALKSPSVMADPQRRAALEAVDLKAWFADMPWRPGHSPVSAAPEYEDYLFEQWTHGAFDDYWAQPGIYAAGAYEQFADVPQVHMSSWYDPYSRTATENYTGLVGRKQGPVRLILGPWTHGDRSLSHAGEVDFGPEATLDHNLAPDFLTLRLRWFDRWLRGVANGVEGEPAVQVFVMGGGSGQRNADGRLDHGGHWRQATTWPLPETDFTPYYCQADGTLSPAKPPAEAEPLTYRYDPKHPVPTVGGPISSGQPMMVGGAFDQRESPVFFGSRWPYRPLAERQDVLVFQTPPLEQEVEVTGPVVAHLWIASDCPDTDFTAKLVDVYPPHADGSDGFAFNLTNGILRVRYRDSWEVPEMMQPGEVYAIRIELFPCSNRFAAGHCIRLDISSSNFPHFDLNFNTGEPEGLSTHARIATNSVYVDASRPSHVVLPMIPTRSNQHG